MEDEARIVGGSEAREGQFPYQLSFQQNALFGGQYHFCGAEIYDEVRTYYQIDELLGPLLTNWYILKGFYQCYFNTE